MSAVKLATGKKLSAISFRYRAVDSRWISPLKTLYLYLHRSLAPFLNPKTNNLNHGICVSQECICVEIFLRNPLNVSLTLSDIALQWVLESERGRETVLAEIISTYKLPACGQRLLQLHLQPLAEEGMLYVTGLLYSVEPSSAKLQTVPEAGNIEATDSNASQVGRVISEIYSDIVYMLDRIFLA